MTWKSIMKSVAKKCLLNEGFKQGSNNMYEKTLDGFYQGIHFYPGSKWLKGRFAVKYYLRYHNPTVENGGTALDVSKAVFLLEDTERAQAWFYEEDAQSIDQLINFYNIEIKPFFTEYNSLKRIITAYESNENDTMNRAACDVEIEGLRWFGLSIDCQLFTLGFVYIHIGEIQKGIDVLTQLITNEDYQEFEYQLKRREIAIAEIKKHQQGI